MLLVAVDPNCGGDGNRRHRRDDSEAGSRIIKEKDLISFEKIVVSVVRAEISSASLELQRAGAARRNCAVKRGAEVAVQIIGGVAQVGAGVAGAAPAQPPKDGAVIAFPTEAPRCEIAGRDKIGHREVGVSWRRGMAGKNRTSNQGMIANPSAGDVAGHVKDGNWVESSGVEHNEFAPADKVLTGRAHAQLDGLRGRVAVDATDDLFDLHKVERGMNAGS